MFKRVSVMFFIAVTMSAASGQSEDPYREKGLSACMEVCGSGWPCEEMVSSFLCEASEAVAYDAATGRCAVANPRFSHYCIWYQGQCYANCTSSNCRICYAD